jgi:hypothetical protein
MPDALDPVPLLKDLHDHGVEHIVIGGFAVNAHGHVRPSKDLDIVPSPAPDNLTRLALLLVDLEAQQVGVGDFRPEEFPYDPTDPAQLAEGANFRLDTARGPLDIMQWVSGVETEDLYAELDRAAVVGNLEEIPIRVCGLEHLRAMKRAAGRPQDLEDLKRLDGVGSEP